MPRLWKSRRSGSTRIVIAAGALLGVAALATTAAFTDVATLNVGNGTAESGIGNPHIFDIAVVLPDNTIEQANTDAGYDWVIDGSDTLVPGGKLSTTIPIFNNTEKIKGDVSFEVQLRNTDGSVTVGGVTRPNITQFLRFTGTVDGTVVFNNVTWDAAKGALGILQPRDTPALDQGDTFVAGPSGNAKSLTLDITYLDVPATANFNGGQSALRVHFDATSMK